MGTVSTLALQLSLIALLITAGTASRYAGRPGAGVVPGMVAVAALFAVAACVAALAGQVTR